MNHFGHAAPVLGYRDEYWICPCGIVLSLKRSRIRELASFPRDRYGHRAVNLCLDGTMRTISVSRLVAEAFVPKDSGAGDYVLHTDDNAANNSATNLRWGTPAENSADMVTRGRQNRGEARALAKLKESDVKTIRRLAAEGTTQRELAARYGVSESSLSSVVRRDTWRHVP